MNIQTLLKTIADEYPGKTAAAQRRRLATALERIGSVTTFQAMRYLDIYDPRPRKLELLAAGYDIALVWDRAITESGEAHRIGRYVLKGVPQRAEK